MKDLRCPAVPLITHDPYFSVWSFADSLNDDSTRHWTGRFMCMIGVMSIDGKPWEFLGQLHPSNERYHCGIRKMRQTSCEVRPLSTEYRFETSEVILKLTFTSPLLPGDLYMVSRPVSYISYEISSKDGNEHKIVLYWGFSPEFCTDSPNQKVTYFEDNLSAGFSSGSELMLKRSGDDCKIEWGSFHVSAPERQYRQLSLREFQNLVFSDNPVDFYPYINCDSSDIDMITVKEECSAGINVYENFIALSYDEIKCIRYFGKELDPWWKKEDRDFNSMLKKALADREDVMSLVNSFETEFKQRTCAVSDKYYKITALAFRQVMAGHKLTFDGDELLYFSKENYSNGCIATVDVTYPSLPLFLLYNPELAKGMLNPIFHMLDLGKWEYEFAPHDAGTYPIAEGQVYGYREKYTEEHPGPLSFQMPVEESGNMILCVAAICKRLNDFSYFSEHLVYLKKWADYLVSVGTDPQSQLCTDDFAGHLNHNCNLSLKGICAVAAFADMLDKIGFTGESEKYFLRAKEFAQIWEEKAFAENHYKLTFDNNDSWSLKYNAVWDKLFGLNLFSENFYRTECAFYKKHLNKYGIPLDNRSDYSKTDWQMWTVKLFDDTEYRDMIVDSMFDFLNETESRIPFSDWIYTSEPVARGFQARTVQGGLFIVLFDKCDFN